MTHQPQTGDQLETKIDATVFEEAKTYAIQVVHTELKGTDPTTKADAVVALDGDTYPIRTFLAEFGFKYTVNFNDEEGVNVWMAPAGVADVAALTDLCEKFGISLETYNAHE